jgi:hypothetical protein
MIARLSSRSFALRVGIALLAVLLLTTLFLVGIAYAGQRQPPPPPPPGEPPVDGLCDFGRNPETLWPDNPSGHPFERHFCDPEGYEFAHPLDSFETDGLYCDEVPECWAFGIAGRID